MRIYETESVVLPQSVQAVGDLPCSLPATSWPQSEDSQGEFHG